MSKRNKKSSAKAPFLETSRDPSEEHPLPAQSFSPKPEKQIQLKDLLKMGGLSFHENVENINDINFSNGIQQTDTLNDLDKAYGKNDQSITSARTYLSNISALSGKISQIRQENKNKEEDQKSNFTAENNVVQSQENKNKFFEMLKLITPEKENNQKPEESENEIAPVLKEGLSVENKNKFFDMLNKISPERQPQITTTEAENANQDLKEIEEFQGQNSIVRRYRNSRQQESEPQPQKIEAPPKPQIVEVKKEIQEKQIPNKITINIIRQENLGVMKTPRQPSQDRQTNVNLESSFLLAQKQIKQTQNEATPPIQPKNERNKTFQQQFQAPIRKKSPQKTKPVWTTLYKKPTQSSAERAQSSSRAPTSSSEAMNSSRAPRKRLGQSNSTENVTLQSNFYMRNKKSMSKSPINARTGLPFKRAVKPQINKQSTAIVENRDQFLFNQIYEILMQNQRNATDPERAFIIYQNIDFSYISLEIIEALIDLFMELEEDSQIQDETTYPWTKEIFMTKIKNNWKMMPNSEKSNLLRLLKKRDL